MAADPTPVIQTVSAWIGLGGVALGATITGGFLLWSQTLTRRSEERRQRRELAINTAIANWHGDHETVRAENVPYAIAPLDHYIIHMVRLSDLLNRQCLTEKEIASELSKIRKATKAAFEAAKEEDKQEGRYPFHNSP